MISSISIGLLVAACTAMAQTAAAPTSFEVASVKSSAPITSKEDKERIGMTVSGARVEIHFAPLAELVRIAYRVKSFQVAGPDWTGSEHFDVLAKMPEGAGQDAMPEMLQTLLAERFKLTLHRESRDHAVYALLVGKGGPKLEEAEPGPDSPGGGWTKTGSTMRMSRKMTLAALADFLGRFGDRPVVDTTGLKATYQITMEIPIEDLIRAKTAAEGAMRGGSDSPSDPGGSPVFGALQKLGLKLEPRKSAMEVLVIDHAQKLPTAN